MIYYTSDLHIGHANIIRLCGRPFSNVDEMNESLITNWNKRITNSDTVYIAGDLIFRSTEDPDVVIKRLKGKKHLILGNHDTTWIKKIDLSKYFESAERMSVINTGRHKATICHYPMMNFEGKYLIHGHIHNHKPASYWPLLKTMDNVLNACVEINGYVPVTFDDLVNNNAMHKLINDV